MIDSRQDLADAVNHALKATGQPERPADEIVQFVGNGMRVLVSSVLGAVPEETLDAGIAAFREHYAAHCLNTTRLYEGVDDTLRLLSGRFRMAVVTNKPAAFSDDILKGLGIRKYFQIVVGGDSLPERKPHPAPVNKALSVLGITADRALMVGDGSQDLVAGRAAGLKTCLATYGFGATTPGAAQKPDFEIASFREIKEILK